MKNTNNIGEEELVRKPSILRLNQFQQMQEKLFIDFPHHLAQHNQMTNYQIPVGIISI